MVRLSLRAKASSRVELCKAHQVGLSASRAAIAPLMVRELRSNGEHPFFRLTKDVGRFACGLEGVEAADPSDFGDFEDFRVLEAIGAAAGELAGDGADGG